MTDWRAVGIGFLVHVLLGLIGFALPGIGHLAAGLIGGCFSRARSLPLAALASGSLLSFLVRDSEAVSSSARGPEARLQVRGTLRVPRSSRKTRSVFRTTSLTRTPLARMVRGA